MPPDPIQRVLSASGLPALNPVQQAAVDAGLLDSKSMIVAAPTASGKTLIAEIAALHAVAQGKKVVYLVPLRSLAGEKHADFKKKYEPGLRVAIATGDLDSPDPWLARADVIIATSEKFDSLLRHGVSWLDRVGLVVADEIHLLHDPSRGPTLEMVLTRLRDRGVRILGLSATISNHDELADWLGAAAVTSDFRPVKLRKGLCHNRVLYFLPGEQRPLEGEEETLFELATAPLKQGKQALVFVSTRKSTESVADKAGRIISKTLSPEQQQALRTLAENILKAVDHPTDQCKKLSALVARGAGFHHAGLNHKQRSLVENAFKAGLLKVLAATPTLAAGINLPAFRVVIRDLKRFSSYRGMDYLPALEIQQMMGRAGRPAFDTEGEAILLPKDTTEARYAWDTYLHGESERIFSKLGVEPVLRVHVLALVASGVVSSKSGLLSFFGKTFYAHQYGDRAALGKKLEKVLALLSDFGFITARTQGLRPDNPFRPASDPGARAGSGPDAALEATPIGKRVSELYLDPMTAHDLIRRLAALRDRGLAPAGLLQAIALTTEARPLLGMRKGDDQLVSEFFHRHAHELPEQEPDPAGADYEDFERSLKTVRFFLDWADEAGEDLLYTRFGVTPGELRARLDIADWLLYATAELAVLCGHQPLLTGIKKVRLRVRYGIREELLALVRLKGVGRVRARQLAQAGIPSLAALRAVPLASLERLLGPALARSLKEQVGAQDDQQVLELGSQRRSAGL